MVPAKPGEDEWGSRQSHHCVVVEHYYTWNTSTVVEHYCVLAWLGALALGGEMQAQERWVWSALSPANSLSVQLRDQRLDFSPPAELQLRQEFRMSFRA